MTKQFLFGCFLLLKAGFLLSQSFTASICVAEVSFSGNTGVDFFTILSDSDGTPYESPHYVNACFGAVGGLVSKPVGYVGGAIPSIGVKLSGGDCANLGNLQVKGKAENGMLFPPRNLETIDGALYYPPTQADFGFEAGMVKHLPNFTVNWQLGDGENWIDIGTSTNPVYVTKRLPSPTDNPTDAAYSYDLFHSLVGISCEAADGNSDDNQIIKAIWGALSTLSVKGKEGQGVFRYASSIEGVSSTRQLLSGQQTNSIGWSKFAIDLIKVHNIQHSDVSSDLISLEGYVYDQQQVAPDFVLFKEFAFTKGGLSDQDDLYSYTVVPKQTVGQSEDDILALFLSKEIEEFSLYTDVKGEAMLTQGEVVNVNGFREFTTTKANGQVFDPVHGVAESSFQSYQTAIASGFGYITSRTLNEADCSCDLNGNGTNNDTAVERYVILISDQLEHFRFTTNVADY